MNHVPDPHHWNQFEPDPSESEANQEESPQDQLAYLMGEVRKEWRAEKPIPNIAVIESSWRNRAREGCEKVLRIRLEALRCAIALRDWTQVEFQFDRVLRALQKLLATGGQIR